MYEAKIVVRGGYAKGVTEDQISEHLSHCVRDCVSSELGIDITSVDVEITLDDQIALESCDRCGHKPVCIIAAHALSFVTDPRHRVVLSRLRPIKGTTAGRTALDALYELLPQWCNRAKDKDA